MYNSSVIYTNILIDDVIIQDWPYIYPRSYLSYNLISWYDIGILLYH